MQHPLRSLCIGCTKFSADDQTAKLFATLCMAPYFAVYHYVVVFHARREIHTGFVLLGILLNTGLGFLLKRMFRQPRPSDTCEALRICHKFGMPSSHTQMMAFIAATACLIYAYRRRSAAQWQRRCQAGAASAAPPSARHPVAQLLAALELLVLVGLAAAVGYARVHLGYHSASQVLAGGAVGAAFAAAWHLLTVVWLRRWYCRVAALACAAGMWLRDTLDWEDVQQAEAEFFVCGGGSHPSSPGSFREKAKAL